MQLDESFVTHAGALPASALQAFKFGLYLIVPISLTAAVTLSEDFLANLVRNVRSSPRITRA